MRLGLGKIKKKTNVMFDTEDQCGDEAFYVTNIEMNFERTRFQPT